VIASVTHVQQGLAAVDAAQHSRGKKHRRLSGQAAVATNVTVVASRRRNIAHAGDGADDAAASAVHHTDTVIEFVRDEDITAAMRHPQSRRTV
jgi:hypothetical protein